MLVNGRRKWPEELKTLYEELVTTSVTTPKANAPLAKASEDDFVPEIVVPRKGLEPSLSYREADFKSAASTIPPPGHSNTERRHNIPCKLANVQGTHITNLVVLTNRYRKSLPTPSLKAYYYLE